MSEADLAPSSDPSDGDFRPEIDLPDDLPPVEPPSAGLIIQLFLVPAVIVAIVVGVYALFGQLATADFDWRQLVVDVQSENPHIRWRGALGLAQMLDADARRGESSQDLASNPEIAQALSELYLDRIHVTGPNEEELKQIEFLSKALGRMRDAEHVVPAFRHGMAEQRDHEVRKHSLIGLAMVCGQFHSSGTPIDDPTLVDDVIAISRETEPLFRHQSAFVLGLLPSDAATARLNVLLEDSDLMTRVNAAISFARSDSLSGIQVFEELLTEAVNWSLDPTQVHTEEEESEYFEKMLMLVNSIKALDQLQPQFDSETRQRISQLLGDVTDSSRDPVLRTEAKQLTLLLAQ